MLPIVVYHGVEKWEVRPFSDEFSGLPPEFLRFLPVFDYHLTNISEMSDEMIAAKEELGALRSLFLAFKYAHDQLQLEQNFGQILIFADGLSNPELIRMLFARIFEFYL